MRIRWMGARGKAAQSPSEHCLESRDGVERVVGQTPQLLHHRRSTQDLQQGGHGQQVHSSGLEMKALNLRVCQVRGEAGHRDGVGHALETTTWVHPLLQVQRWPVALCRSHT